MLQNAMNQSNLIFKTYIVNTHVIIDGSTFVLSNCLSVYSLYAGNLCFRVPTAALWACHFWSYSAIVFGLISSNTDVLFRGTEEPNHVFEPVNKQQKMSTHVFWKVFMK